MSKRHESKHKIDRRLGENIWGRPKSPLNARAYGPGQHGQRRKGKTSDYGLQLRAKQKLKGYYGSMTEKAFKKLYIEASRIRGDTGEKLIGLLESRLDVGDLPRQVRADPVRRPPVREPRPRAGQRQARHHPVLPGQGRRQDRAQGEVASSSASSSRPASSPSATCRSTSKSTTARWPRPMSACRRCADVPYPVQMEPNLVVEFYSR